MDESRKKKVILFLLVLIFGTFVLNHGIRVSCLNIADCYGGAFCYGDSYYIVGYDECKFQCINGGEASEWYYCTPIPPRKID